MPLMQMGLMSYTLFVQLQMADLFFVELQIQVLTAITVETKEEVSIIGLLKSIRWEMFCGTRVSVEAEMKFHVQLNSQMMEDILSGATLIRRFQEKKLRIILIWLLITGY